MVKINLLGFFKKHKAFPLLPVSVVIHFPIPVTLWLLKSVRWIILDVCMLYLENTKKHLPGKCNGIPSENSRVFIQQAEEPVGH